MDKTPISSKELADYIRNEFTRHSITIISVYLFGSRALGSARSDSDWDFLVIIPHKIERSLQRKILAHIRKKFIFDYDIDSDILILSENEIISAREDKGRISFYALRDGIAV